MEVVTRIDIAAEPSAAWSALVDVRQWPKWSASMDSVEPLDEGPLRLGSRARIKQPKMPSLVWQVTEITEGRSFTWQTKSPGVVTTGRHEIAAAEGGSTLVLTLEQRGLLAGIVGLLSGSRTRRYLRMEAEGLKACSEQAGTAVS